MYPAFGLAFWVGKRTLLEMAEVLLNFVHPALEKSHVNRALLACAKDCDEVMVNDLYESYPDFQVDAGKEKGLMEAHDSVVFQFPLYWYSSPSLLKEWFDIVLQYGWAYGYDAKALVGKKARFAVTTGGPEGSYTKEGHNGFTMDEFLRPMLGTVGLCGMEVGEPFFVHDALHLEGEKLNQVVSNYGSWLLEEV